MRFLDRLPGRGRRDQVEVVVNTRRGCGLCVQAEQLVAREARGANVTHVDVDSDPELQERYGVRVPVVVVDGREVAELQVSPGAVARAVRVAARSRAVGQAARGDLPPGAHR